MSFFGEDLQTLLSCLENSRTCRPHRIQANRPDVRVRDMLTVPDKIDRSDLPVRLHMPSVGWRKHFHPPGRAREKRIEIPRKVSEKGLQVRCVLIPATENEAFVDRHPGNADQAETREIERLRKMLIETGRDQATVRFVAPTMIRTDEPLRLARL